MKTLTPEDVELRKLKRIIMSKIQAHAKVAGWVSSFGGEPRNESTLTESIAKAVTRHINKARKQQPEIPTLVELKNGSDNLVHYDNEELSKRIAQLKKPTKKEQS